MILLSGGHCTNKNLEFRDRPINNGSRLDDEGRLLSLQKGFDDVTSGLNRLEIFTKQKLEELSKLVFSNNNNNINNNRDVTEKRSLIGQLFFTML